MQVNIPVHGSYGIASYLQFLFHFRNSKAKVPTNISCEQTNWKNKFAPSNLWIFNPPQLVQFFPFMCTPVALRGQDRSRAWSADPQGFPPVPADQPYPSHSGCSPVLFVPFSINCDVTSFRSQVFFGQIERRSPQLLPETKLHISP